MELVMRQITYYVDQFLNWLRNDTLEAERARKVLTGLGIAAVTIITVSTLNWMGVISWKTSFTLLIAGSIGYGVIRYLLNKQAHSVPASTGLEEVPEEMEDTSEEERARSDTQPIPVVRGEVAEDTLARSHEEELLHRYPPGKPVQAFYRGPKALIKRIAKPVGIAVIILAIPVLVFTLQLSLTDFDVPPVAWLIYGVPAAIYGLYLVFIIKKELYRYRNWRIVVKPHMLEMYMPDSRLYLLPGGQPNLPITPHITPNLEERTLSEQIVPAFRRTRSVTLDGLGREDDMFHHMPDIQDGEDLVELIKELATVAALRGSGL
jgi:hypothetical protein